MTAKSRSEVADSDVASRLPDEVLEALFLLSSAAVGFLLNVVVIACLLSVRSLRTISSIFVLHGCLLDAVKCLYSVPFATSLLRRGPPNSCAVLGGSLCPAGSMYSASIYCVDVRQTAVQFLEGLCPAGSIHTLCLSVYYADVCQTAVQFLEGLSSCWSPPRRST